jgi:hypothetical protein
MRTAKVIVSDLSGKGNRIFHAGDEVNESYFPIGNFDKLIEGKYIEEVSGVKVETTETVESPEKTETVESAESTESTTEEVTTKKRKK